MVIPAEQLKRIETIYLHENPDPDAFFSWAAVRMFLLGAKRARIVLQPANWGGNGMGPNDLALDMEAGERGLKGVKDPDGKRHSCFALVMERYAPPEARAELAHIISYVDMQDSAGNVAKALLPEASQEVRDLFSATGLSAHVSALKAVHGENISLIVSRLEEYLRGARIVGCRRIKTEKEADKAELFAEGQVALVVDLPPAISYALYARGVRFVVFQNKYGTGVAREQTETMRVDHSAIRQVVEDAKEKIAVLGSSGGSGEWFRHTDGFLFANGTPKSKASIPSKVDPRALVAAVVSALAEHDAQKNKKA